jgi:hypothetical protein
MRMKGLFARDIRKRFEPVVKVYDRRTLLDELRQFVITGSIERSIDEFLDEFTRSLENRLRGARGPDGMAVWLTGFFGSGKSHLAKVLGHVIENSVVDEASGLRAMEVFEVHLDEPTLRLGREIRRALKQIRDKVWCRTIPFEIKSRQDQTNRESVTEICLRSFYEALGLCPTVYLARLERRLQREGYYEAFLEKYRELHGRDWLEDRREHAFFKDQMFAALSVILDRPVAAVREMVEEYQAHHGRVDPERFAREVLEYLDEIREEVAPREPHVLFVVDEMGQFIGDSSERIEELRAIIEQCGSQGAGRIWFIATSQEALDQVVDRTGLKLSQLGKLDARFSAKISLTSEEIRKVVGERLLRKREAEAVRATLRGLYEAHEGYLAELSNLHLSRRLPRLDPESFAASYPFLPHLIPLAQEIFDAMRGFKLSGSERNLIGVAQAILDKLAEETPGVLVPLDMLFDQVRNELSASDYLGTNGMRAIRESDEKVCTEPIPASRVLKVLWLISRLEWVPRTPEVISKLLVDRVGRDLSRLRVDVEDVLERLREAGYVGRDEATGQYKYLSEKERDLEEAIQREIAGYNIGVAIRRVRALLRNKVLTGAKLGEHRVTYGKQGIFEFGLELDGEPIRSGGEISVRVYSPLSRRDLEEIEQENLARGSRGRTIWWVAGAVPGLVDRLKRAEALEQVLKKPRWTKDANDETRKVLREKRRELSALESRIVADLERALREGCIFYSGEEFELDGARDLKGIVSDAVQIMIGHLYSRFPTADRKFDERNIARYLERNTRNLARLDPELGLFDSQDQLNTHAALVQTIHEELQRRTDEGEDLSGKALLEHFGRIPFGWPPALVRLVLAAMFRGGAVILRPSDTDRRIFDFSEPDVDRYFTRVLRFKSTEFEPTSGGLTSGEVKAAIEALTEMDETGVRESANAIAARLKEKAVEMVRVAKAAEQKVGDTGLPLPEVYKRAEAITSGVTANPDPVAVVRRFISDRTAWKELWSFVEDYQRFVDQGHDRRWRAFSRLLEVAREAPGLASGEEGIAASAALGDLETIVKSREILAKWKVYQERFAVVRDRYRALYSAAYQAALAAVSALKEEVRGSELFRMLDETRARTVLDAFFGPRGTLYLPANLDLASTEQLLNATRERKISELESIRLAVPGHRKAIYQRIEKEIAEQAGSVQEAADSQREVFVLDTRARLAGRRFVSPQEFRRFWEGIGEEIEAKLARGIEVSIE